MFCSKCGKTLKSDAINCQYCGAVVGDSRFDGNGYTAAQSRFQSGEPQSDVQESPAYKRTTYIASETDGESPAGGDVYSRTTYRPVLGEDKPVADAVDGGEAVMGERDDEQLDQEAAAIMEPMSDEAMTEEPAPALEAEAAGDEPEAVPTRAERAGRTEKFVPEKPAAHKRATVPVREGGEGEPDEDEDDDIKIAPLRPIKKTGISPEVMQYMERVDQTGVKAKRSIKDIIQPAAAPAGDEPPADPVEGGEIDVSGGTVAVAPGGANWVKRLIIVACVAIILCVAVWALLTMAARTSSPLQGVNPDVRTKGIEILKAQSATTHRNDLIKLMQEDLTGLKANEKIQESRDAIAALMPDSPLSNDGLFIEALQSVQGIISEATVAESYGVLNQGDQAAADMFNGEANRLWGDINNSIIRLETAKDGDELQGIISGAVQSLATPEPTLEPTPTPSNEVLKKGMFNDSRVKRLQTRLTELGWFKSTVDGDYGSTTQLTVQQFQEAAGIEPADGITDRRTWDAVHAADAVTRDQANANKPAATPTLSPVGENAAGVVETTNIEPIDPAMVEEDTAVTP